MKKIYKAICFLFFSFTLAATSKAQTPLVAGDILFTGFNCDLTDDNFSFVLLKSIANNTQIRFTDYGWRTNTSSFNSGGTGESEIVFTAVGSINAGVEITIVGSASPTATLSIGGSAGTVAFTSGSLGGGTALTTLSLSTSGDQLFAYQGSFGSPTFIAGVHFNSYSAAPGGDGVYTTDADWDGISGPAPSANNSSKPVSLTAGVSSVWLGTAGATPPITTEPENAVYNCTGTLNSVANVQAAVCNRANWTMNDATPYTLPSGCTYLSTPAPSFTTQPTASSSCAGLSASFNVVATGSGITFSWQEATNAAFTTGVTTLSNTGIYSISSTGTTSTLTISDNTSVNGRFYRCTATNLGGAVNSSIVGLTATANLLPTGNTSVTQTAGTGNSGFYFASACRLLGKVVPSGGSPISGSVTTEVWVDGSVGSVGPIPYGQRHYQITPTAGSTATVTLYFTQTEFDNFNAHPGSALDLPTGPADNAGKANLRIGKLGGSSGDGSGSPGSYTGGRSVIDPVDANIVWDATNSRWAVTFDVAGFSGFFVQSTNVILPVKLISFTGRLNSDKTVSLRWETAEQVNMQHYILEESSDGAVFRTLATIPAGNGVSGVYNFNDMVVPSGNNYYRLKMIDLSGKTENSNIININLKANIQVNVYPNPVTDVLTIQQFGTVLHKKATLTDFQGKELIRIQLTGLQQSVDMSALATGVYLLKMDDGTLFKVVKQ